VKHRNLNVTLQFFRVDFFIAKIEIFQFDIQYQQIKYNSYYNFKYIVLLLLYEAFENILFLLSLHFVICIQYQYTHVKKIQI